MANFQLSVSKILSEFCKNIRLRCTRNIHFTWNSFCDGCDRFKWICVHANRHSDYTSLFVHCTHVLRHTNQYHQCSYCWTVSDGFKVRFILFFFFVGLISVMCTIFLHESINRAMAMCISLMFGRLGGVVGANVAALLLDNHCQSAFYLSGSSLLGKLQWNLELFFFWRIFRNSFKLYFIHSYRRIGILHSKYPQKSLEIK